MLSPAIRPALVDDFAAIASLKDQGHIAEEREENARVREFTVSAFRDMGFEVADCHTNHIFVNLRRLIRVEGDDAEVIDGPSTKLEARS